MSTARPLTTIGTRMSTDLLTLAQWLSPTFPVGAFAYSHGLETAVRDKRIPDADGIHAWLSAILTEGSGRSDAILLSLAHRADDPAEADWEARAFAASGERIRESERQGAAFAATVRAVWRLELPDLMYPVAVGRAARLAGLPLVPTAALYLQSFASNLVSAAVRLVPLGQTEGQSVLARLSPLCQNLAEEAEDLDADDLFSNAFASDIAAMKHETMQPRLFQT